MMRIFGFTVLEWNILIVMAGLLLSVAGHVLGGGTDEPSGLVYSALDETGGLIEIVGAVDGYSDAADPGALGSVSFTVRLFLGDMGGVDMSRATVLFSDGGGAVVVPSGAEGDVLPYWTITDRLNRAPFQTVDDDDILEPGESFVVRVFFPHPLGSGETFTLTVTPPGGHAETMKRTVPPRVTPVTNLG